jgi:hypothetical protein
MMDGEENFHFRKAMGSRQYANRTLRGLAQPSLLPIAY